MIPIRFHRAVLFQFSKGVRSLNFPK